MQFIVKATELKAAIDKLKHDFYVYYPVKANSNSKLVGFLDSFVDGYEVDSLFHMQTLIQKHGVSPDRIIYGYPLKTAKDISDALNMGVSTLVIDREQECRELLRITKKQLRVIVRIDVSNLIDDAGVELKWGAGVEEAKKIVRLIKQSHFYFLGYSFYLPSELNSFSNMSIIIDKLFDELNAGDFDLIDVGGSVKPEELPFLIDKIRKKAEKTKTKFAIEQGQYLLNPFIDLEVRVLDVRDRGRTKLVFIDTGIYHGLLDVILKRVNYEIKSKKTGIGEPFLVCGDSSDVLDVIGEYTLPKDIRPGDVLTIVGCGAYCEEFITQFCKKKKPTIRLI